MIKESKYPTWLRRVLDYLALIAQTMHPKLTAATRALSKACTFLSEGYLLFLCPIDPE
jgi:hypothetical protein